MFAPTESAERITCTPRVHRSIVGQSTTAARRESANTFASLYAIRSS